MESNTAKNTNTPKAIEPMNYIIWMLLNLEYNKYGEFHGGIQIF